MFSSRKFISSMNHLIDSKSISSDVCLRKGSDSTNAVFVGSVLLSTIDQDELEQASVESGISGIR